MPELPERTAWPLRHWCKRVGIAPATIYPEIYAGRLRTAKLGGRRIVTLADELEYFALLKRETTEADAARLAKKAAAASEAESAVTD
jgi:predicted site-specific integrase-resolvase